MHTTQIVVNGEPRQVHHNGDWSGEVYLDGDTKGCSSSVFASVVAKILETRLRDSLDSGNYSDLARIAQALTVVEETAMLINSALRYQRNGDS